MASAVPIGSAPAPAAPAPNGGAPAAAPAAPWYGEITDPDLKGFAELKKPTDAATALKGWRDAEKVIGVPREQLLRLPADLSKATPEELAAIHDRLGRPKTADEYTIKPIEGDEASAAFTAKFKPVLHSLGLSNSQAVALQNVWNEYVKSTATDMDRAQEQQEKIDLDTLHREWPGEVFSQREEMGRRAVREFISPVAGEKTPEVLGKIEDAIGTAMFLKLFSGIGEKVGEAKYVDGAQGGTSG